MGMTTDFWMPTRWTRLADKRMNAHQTWDDIMPTKLTMKELRGLKDRRLSIGITSKDMCEKVGVHHDAISLWERGAVTPQRKNLIAWFRAIEELEGM